MAENQEHKIKQLRVDSDKLMDALDDLKLTEGRKRNEEISTPEFHDLADQVERKSKRLFHLAKGEELDGDAVATTDQTINETPRDHPRLS